MALHAKDVVSYCVLVATVLTLFAAVVDCQIQFNATGYTVGEADGTTNEVKLCLHDNDTNATVYITSVGETASKLQSKNNN